MRRTSLIFRKYARTLILWMGGLTCLAGLVHLAVVADSQRHGVAELLNAEARTARGQVDRFLDEIVFSLRWIDDIDQPEVPVDLDAFRESGYRLLRREPSILSLAYYDTGGCKRLSVSRLEPDALTDCRGGDVSGPPDAFFERARSAGVAFGTVFFPDGSEPHMYVGVASRGQGTGALIAEINLRVIHDSIAAIQVGKTGRTFVVDGMRRLLAYPDVTLVLGQTELPGTFPLDEADHGLLFGVDPGGIRVVTASRMVERAGWHVVVEEPVSEALEPVYAALWTTGGIVLAAIFGSLAAGFVVAARLSKPLSMLREGALRVAQGDLTTRVTVSTGDEIEQVAHEFNRMAYALAEAREDLESKVLDRTAALQETTEMVQRQATDLTQLNGELAQSLEEVRRGKEDAERANAAKTRFLAVASHDLRQPMHAISLLIGVLSERIRYPEVSSIVRKVQGSVDAMEELFSSLLDISKLDAGAVKPTIEEFPLDELLLRLGQAFGPLAELKGIQLIIEPSSRLVRSDAALLERILANLVSNGVRYTREGSVSVRCIVQGQEIGLRVEDTGIGIPPEFKGQIFDEFFQIPGDSRDSAKGLGLGLSIVRRCADLLGHRLTMESDPSGSRFEITVPLAGVMESATMADIVTRPISDRLASAFVVVIDDDAGSRDAAEAVYRQWGCRVVAASSVEQALSELREHLRSPDLLVCDYTLGGGSTGVRAIEAIRQEEDSFIPAIIVTGEWARAEAVDPSAAIVLLQKPVGTERLKEVSEQLLYSQEWVGFHSAISDHGVAPTNPDDRQIGVPIVRRR